MSEEIEQGSAEWFQARCGAFTASEFWALCERDKRSKTPKYLAERHNVIMRVVAERLTGYPAKDEFFSKATQWGKDVEPATITAYEVDTGYITRECGFIKHPKYTFAGASPDRLVGDDGGVEAKSPKNIMIHLERINAPMPREMIWQCIGGMWVTGAKWWHWISYSPLIAANHPDIGLVLHRIERGGVIKLEDEELVVDECIALLEREILAAESAVRSILKGYGVKT